MGQAVDLSGTLPGVPQPLHDADEVPQHYLSMKGFISRRSQVASRRTPGSAGKLRKKIERYPAQSTLAGQADSLSQIAAGM